MLAAVEIRQSCNLEYEEEKDTDVVDPGLFIDELPQPYKYIDFLLDELLCNAFDLFSERCEKRRIESRRQKVADLNCEAYIFGYGLPDVILSDYSAVVLFGNGSSFTMVDSDIYATKQDATETSGKRNEMKYSYQRKLSSSAWLICTSDSSGKVYLYGLFDCHLFLLKEFQDLDSTTGALSIACSVSLSNDASHMAVCWIGETEKALNMEVFSLPKDSWLKELSEAASRAKVKQDDQISTMVTQDDSLQDPQQDESSVLSIAVPDENDNQAEGSSESSPAEHNYSFSKPTSIMKIQLLDPGSKPTPLSLGTALKLVEGENAPIGSGLAHLLTPLFCESYMNKMKENYDDYIRFLKPEDVTQTVPFVSFLAATKQGSSSDAPVTDLPPAMVAVGRPGFNQIFGYSLNKSSKDTMRKPDLVLPNAASIVFMAVSGCTTLLALVTEVGHLIIWNRQLARPLKIECLPEEIVPTFFKFTSLEGQISVEERLLLGISTDYYQFVQVHCSYYECSQFVSVIDRSSLERDDVLDVVHCGTRPSWVAGVRQSGRITIFDLTTNDAVAHIKPLDGFAFSFKPDPFICFVDSKIFVKAVRTDVSKDLDTDRPQGGVLIYTSDNVMDTEEGEAVLKVGSRTSSSKKQLPLKRDWKLELLRRYQQRDERARRVRRRWTQFKQELEMKAA